MARDETIRLSLIDGVTRTLGQIREGVSGVGSDLVKLNQGAELAAKGFGLIGGAITGIGSAVSGVANLEEALASLQAVTGASAEDFGKLKAAAVDASERTRFSAIEATQGLTELARAGFDATGAISALGPTLALAQGQGLSVGESVQFLTTTLTQFGLAASEAGRVADVFASAADKSQLDVRQLASSMSYAAPIANQLGMSLEETTAIIGKLADEGFRGERGGTALTNALTALLDPSSKFSKALDDAGIKTRDFSEVIQALADKGDGAKKVLLALDASATPAITALAKKGSDGITLLTKALNEARGAAQATSDKLGETFNAELDRLINTITNVRNEFLEPILKPLGDELDAIAVKLRTFANSEAFKQVSAEIQQFVIDGLGALQKFITEFDLSTTAEEARQFATDTREALAQVRDAFNVTLTAGGNLADGMSAAFSSSVSAIAAALSSTAGALATFSDEAEAISVSLAAIADESAIEAGDALGRIAERTRKAAEESDKAAREIVALRKEYVSAVGPLNAFGKSLEGQLASTQGLAPAFDATRNSVMRLGAEAKDAAEDLRQIPKAAKLTEVTLEKLAGGAEQAAIGLERLRLATLTSAIAALARENLQGTDTFRALVAEVAKTEASIANMQEAIDKAKGAQEDLSDKTDSAANSLRNFASAAGDAGDAADDLKSSNSQVADSFGNIGNKSSETAVSLGNLSEAFVRQALEAAGAAKSAKDYIDTLNRYFAAGADQEEKIKARLDQLSRQNVALSEEEQIRKRLALQYGTSSTLLDELVRKELELARAKKQANDETKRGIQIEEQRTAGFGGVGTGQQAEATGGATGGRVRPTEMTRGDRGAPQIVINVQGMTTDQARQFVEQSVVPELERINRLSR